MERIERLFEDLANETIYEIFEYLDVYHIYQGFFSLNKRLKNLIINTNLPIQIKFSIQSKTNFELFHNDLILPSKHRINSLHLSNFFTIDLIFPSPHLICQYFQLEQIIFNHIHTKYFNNLFTYLINLPKLYSLKLSLIDLIDDPSHLLISIFRLPYLKSCELTYKIKPNSRLSFINLTEYQQNSMEYFLINGHFRFDLLTDLFSCLPNLRYLSIDYLVVMVCYNIDPPSIILKHLKYVSIKLTHVYVSLLEKIIQYYFYYVEKLYISMENNLPILNPKLWEQLIKFSMPNLRVFNLNYTEPKKSPEAWFYSSIVPFNDLFWTNKQRFFTHEENPDNRILYSNPYRSKDYKFYWKPINETCGLDIEQKMFYSVKHLHIYGDQATKNFEKYFPNIEELTIEKYFRIFDEYSISTILNRIFPLKQLTKLFIRGFEFSLEEILKLLRSTPNLNTLKLDYLSYDENELELVEENDIFNQVKNFHFRQSCTLDDIELFFYLFPQLEYLKIGMDRREIYEIIRYLFSNINNETYRLRFLCISEIRRKYLEKLDTLIKSENLVENYSMKLFDQNLYLWW